MGGLDQEKSEERKYDHGFFSSEVNTLAAMSETFFPPLSPTCCFQAAEEENQTPITKAVRFFMEASASQPPIPDEVKLNYDCRGRIDMEKSILGLLGTDEDCVAAVVEQNGDISALWKALLGREMALHQSVLEHDIVQKRASSASLVQASDLHSH
ncbi:hypothetical protein V6N11_029471 [Hibiscus sabdariffa]|uniref:Uncharacterized protein n=1 Tax=Hibiscus sabdariffa TaxID=183260 RepID=A0ABR2P6R5_9ROSI